MVGTWMFLLPDHSGFGGTITAPYSMDLVEDGRKATFYSWYNPNYIFNEDPERMWVMLF
jgi:hypothetical protein